MKTVSVKFKKSGRWAVTLEKQIKVQADQVVDNLPITFAHIVVDAGKGEIVDSPATEFEESESEKDGLITTSLFSDTELGSMSISQLQKAGEKYDVTDNKKSDLVDKILDAQVYTQEYLDLLEDEDVAAICEAKELDPEVIDSVEKAVTAILESQEDSDKDSDEDSEQSHRSRG